MVSRLVERARFVTADRVALGFAALVIVLAAVSGESQGTGVLEGVDGWAMVLLALAGALVVAGRWFPGAAALAVVAVTLIWYESGYTSGLVNVAPLIAFYRLGVSEEQRRKMVVTAIGVAALLVDIGVVGDGGWRESLAAAGYLVIATLFGELVRNRRMLVERYAQRAERAEADARRQVTEERLRIAQDLHDLLAHTVSVMTVQAGVAADALDRDRGEARSALADIRQAGREAMGEVRATVAVLRSGADPMLTAPAPRIDQLGTLVDATREQGLEVVVDMTLSGRPLPEVVELTVFRIVQEGLTNTMRHAAGASRARVAVLEEGSRLTVEVHDDGRATGGPVSAGLGLRGMAERVESIGGELWHGRHPGGGWVVRATLPVGGVGR